MNELSIAVLPFVLRSPDTTMEYFSDGVTEEIINALARIEGLRVTSRTSSFFFKGKQVPLQEIAERLKVDILLEGSIRIAGDQVRISAQLIQAAEDFQFWAGSWDRRLEDIFDLQDEISLLIAEHIREQAGHFELGEHLVRKQTGNLDAYNYTLQAKFLFNRWNPEEVQQAISLFEKALELDPDYTEAYVGLADAYGFLATTQFIPMQEGWARVVEYTQKALKLDPHNAGAHYQLANLAFFTDCDFAEAARHTVRSVELKPSYPEAQQYMAFLYMLTGEMDMARQHLQLALAIDPMSQETLFYQAYYHYRNQDLKKALELLDQCLLANPQNIPALTVKAYALILLERFEEALALLDAVPEALVIPDEHLGIRCLAYINSGDKERAEASLAELEHAARGPIAFQAHSYLYLAYAALGRSDDAFQWLEEALKLKSSIFLLSFSDPLAAALHQDPRYRNFHEKLYPAGWTKTSVSGEKKGLLPDAEAEKAVTKLEVFMTEERPFLNPGLTLRSLGDMVGIHPNHLSWLLNEKTGQNFNEYINRYRVDHFRILARDPANSHISLLGLAYESGFNSKTSFNTFFRKMTGMTPSAWLKISD